MKAEDIVELLRLKYPEQKNGYNTCVVLEQVPDGTSMFQSRWIDVAVFHMWESKKLTRSAFEIKVSRSDFLSELNHPEKHQWCKDCFHEFWFVAPKDVIQLEELPVGAGWMYPRGKRLCIARHAVRNPNPELNDVLLAGFLRAAWKEIQRVIKDGFNEAIQNDYDYIKAKLYADGTQKFLAERGITIYPENETEVFEALEKATMDKQLQQDRDHFLEVTGHFQNDLLSLLNLFLVVAKKSLFLRDQNSRYIVEKYGGNDGYGIEALKEFAKKDRYSYGKRYAELAEILLNWEKLS